MSPQELANRLTCLNAAAQIVEAIDNPVLQKELSLDLQGWKYDLIPWGVRFRYDGPHYQDRTGIVAALDLPSTMQTSSMRGDSSATLVRMDG